MAAFLLVCFAILPHDAATVDRVDLVEVNHFYDENGKRVFDQLIFYDWRPVQGDYAVRAWRLMKSEQQYPVKDWRRNEWSVTWTECDFQLRQVRARCFRETWTQYDPELAARDGLPKERRKRLVFESQ